MQIHQVAMRAVNLERAVDFWATHFDARRIEIFDPPGLGFVEIGGVRLLFETSAESALVYLRVDDLDQTVERLRAAGLQITTEPHCIFDDADGLFGEPAQEWMAFCLDSEGNTVGLCERRR